MVLIECDIVVKVKLQFCWKSKLIGYLLTNYLLGLFPHYFETWGSINVTVKTAVCWLLHSYWIIFLIHARV